MVNELSARKELDIETNLETVSHSAQRRRFLRLASGAAAVVAVGSASQASAATRATAAPRKIVLPRIAALTEAEQPSPESSDRRARRVGYAVVGLGDLSVKQILPAFGQSKHAKVVALVTGDRAKGLSLAQQYDVDERSVFDYADFDAIAQRPDVEAVYIVLPNSLHAEFTIRAASAGKHVLCEKPMATSAADCRRMIAACKAASRKLMIAYRSQYEPHNRALVKLVKSGELGALKSLVTSNSQSMGPPSHWRLKQTLAGGGPLPDVGIYCFNQARFVSGEEPVEVWGQMTRSPNDSRFTEVEEAAHFTLRFPSGFVAVCNSSYAAHKSQFLRLEGSKAWAEISPAYAYQGQKLRWKRLVDDQDTSFEPQIIEANQFALELDHFAQCIRNAVPPHTPGEEGLQDQLIVEAIYVSAASGRPVALTSPGPTRGPEPKDLT